MPPLGLEVKPFLRVRFAQQDRRDRRCSASNDTGVEWAGILDVEAQHPSSKLYDTYRHFCFDMGRKPQSSSSFKRALDKLPSVYQSRTSSGMYWHGIRPQIKTIV